LPSVRLFLALECPDFDSGPLEHELNAKPAGSYHITLAFLGERPEAAGVAEAVAPACAGRLPLRLEYRGLGAFHSSRAARVAWVGVRGAGLTELAQAVRSAAQSQDRPFVGHVTLARFRPPRDIRPLLQRYSDCDCGSGTVEFVTLFRSTLQRGGAVHEPLFHIGGNGRAEAITV
jgi:2'-5' RNA ligase